MVYDTSDLDPLVAEYEKRQTTLEDLLDDYIAKLRRGKKIKPAKVGMETVEGDLHVKAGPGSWFGTRPPWEFGFKTRHAPFFCGWWLGWRVGVEGWGGGGGPGQGSVDVEQAGGVGACHNPFAWAPGLPTPEQTTVLGPSMGAWGRDKYGLKPKKIDSLEFLQCVWGGGRVTGRRLAGISGSRGGDRGRCPRPRSLGTLQ